MADATALPWLVAQYSAWLQLGEIAHIIAEVQLDFFAVLNQRLRHTEYPYFSY